jgi:hypothetical protein
MHLNIYLPGVKEGRHISDGAYKVNTANTYNKKAVDNTTDTE